MNNGNEEKLIQAARYGSEGGLKFFIKRVNDINFKDERGMTSLHWAAIRGIISCVEILIAAGSDKSLTDNNGNTALHFAAKNGFLDIQRYLIRIGGDIHLKNKESLTPADYAKLRVEEND